MGRRVVPFGRNRALGISGRLSARNLWFLVSAGLGCGGRHGTWGRQCFGPNLHAEATESVT